jgi:hypothetical protein
MGSSASKAIQLNLNSEPGWPEPSYMFYTTPMFLIPYKSKQNEKTTRFLESAANLQPGF